MPSTPIEGPSSSRACECSAWRHWTSEREHAAYHRAWQTGLSVPPSLWPDPTGAPARSSVVVTMASSFAERRFAHRLSALLQRECGHDGAGWPRTRILPDPECLRCFVDVDDRRAVGFAITLDVSDWKRIDLASGAMDRPPGTPVRVGVGWVWVCRDRRRQGVATGLIEAVCCDRQVNAEALAWTTPMTDEGRALAVRYAVGGRIYLA